jgi:hypothetical protein
VPVGRFAKRFFCLVFGLPEGSPQLELQR